MSGQGSVELAPLLSACHDLAGRAGTVVRDVFLTGNLQAVDKDPENLTDSKSVNDKAEDKKLNDPQTIADLSAQKLISGSLARAFPNVKLIGEEGDLAVDEEDTVMPDVKKLQDLLASLPKELETVDASDLTVWIDPVDGTREFTEGEVECVTVLIGIAYKGEAIAGFVGQPFKNYDEVKRTATPTVVWGVKGVGAFGYDKVDPFPKSGARRYIVCSNSHFNQEIKDYSEACKPDKLIRHGGCGGKFLKLLKGEADAYINPSPGTKKWDTCAPHAILSAAGGTVTLPNGAEFVYDDNNHPNKEGFVATLQGDHSSYVISKI